MTMIGLTTAVSIGPASITRVLRTAIQMEIATVAIATELDFQSRRLGRESVRCAGTRRRYLLIPTKPE
jgi:hypothetical protein